MPEIAELIPLARSGDTAALAQLQGLDAHRAANIQARADSLNDETRSVRAVMSTESPIPMMDWERWEMVPEILRADGMIAPAQVPFLDAHQRYSVADVIGSVRDFQASANAVEGVIFFARTDAAQQAFDLVRDGHITDVSVGYDATVRTYIPKGESATVNGKRYDGPLSVVTQWKLKELSLVPIGADPNAKLRAALSQFLTPPAGISAPTTQQDRAMPDEEANNTAPSAAENVSTIRAEAAKEERDRQREINSMCAKLSLPDAIRARLIDDGATVEEARKVALEEVGKRAKEGGGAQELPATFLGLSNAEIRKYSLFRGINAMVERNWKKAGFELECSRAISDALGKEPQGLFVPYDWQRQGQAQQARASVGVDTAGGYLVGTTHMAGSFIDNLRAQSVIMGRGAYIMDGLVGDVTIPKKTGNATFYWLAENEDVDDSDLAFGQITLRPRTVAGAVSITRKLLKQSSPAAEGLISMDLQEGAALAIDLAAMLGSGQKDPLGVMNHGGIKTQSVATPGAMTWAEAVGFETAIASANALRGSFGWVTTPAVKGAAKTTKKDAGSGVFVMEGDSINGFPVATTTQMTQHGVLFGNFGNLIIGMWGVLDVKPDEAARAASGGLILRVFQDVDIAVRHVESFCKNS